MFKKRKQKKTKTIELARLAETLRKEAPDLYRQLFEDSEVKEESKETTEKINKTLKSLGYNESDIDALKQEILRQKRGDISYTTIQILKIIFLFIILHTLLQLAIVLFSVVPKIPLFFYY
jgi:Holliday junction resolvasome RuvABC DNA-binding subunit